MRIYRQYDSKLLKYIAVIHQMDMFIPHHHSKETRSTY